MKKPNVMVTEFRLGGKPKSAPETSDEDEGEPMAVDEEGKRSAAKVLCRLLGADPSKADAVMKALDDYLACAGCSPDDDEVEPDADDEDGGEEGRSKY